MYVAGEHVGCDNEFFAAWNGNRPGILEKRRLPGERPEIAVDDRKLVSCTSVPGAARDAGRVSAPPCQARRSPARLVGGEESLGDIDVFGDRHAPECHDAKPARTAPQRRIARSVRSMRVSGQVGGNAASMTGSMRRWSSTTPGRVRGRTPSADRSCSLPAPRQAGARNSPIGRQRSADLHLVERLCAPRRAAPRWFAGCRRHLTALSFVSLCFTAIILSAASALLALVHFTDAGARPYLLVILDGQDAVTDSEPVGHGKLHQPARRFIRHRIVVRRLPRMTHPSAT